MVLLVIDVQKGITDERLYDFSGFIRNTKKIIDATRENDIEVIYIQHDDGPGSGFSVGDEEFEIYDGIRPLDSEKCYYKTINSCFGNKELNHYLKEKQDHTLIMVGLQTNFCIDASIKSAFERGYEVIVPLGANSTFDNAYMDKEATYQYYNEMMWPNRFARCITVDETIGLMKQEKCE